MTKEIFKLHVDGDPVLRQVCEEITEDYPNLKEVVQKMHNTLATTKLGVGLAAPQVGLPIRMFILGDKFNNKVFINPEVSLKGKIKKGNEGCLSVPGVWADVDRNVIVKVKYYDENFVLHNEKFRDFEAVVIQHETDHLNGIEFYDHVSEKELDELLPDIESLRKGEFPDTGNDYFKHGNHT